MIDKKSNLIWIDLEMTGLNPIKDRIIEIAVIVTDKNLNIIAEGEAMAINQPTSLLEKMDEWNTEHHTDSGLWARVEASQITVQDAERLTLEFLKEHVPIHRSPMCGNTICQDRRFLAKWMPELENYFHYRQIDVSSIKELFSRWNPKILDGLVKKGNHLALDDVRESIEELKYYRQFLGELNTQNLL